MNRLALASLALAAAVACVPKNTTPVASIPTLPTLAAVMDNQATYADPVFSKAGQATFSDADFASFAELGQRITATSARIKNFTKGPEFDAVADKLGQKAQALGAAGAAKNAAGATAALTEMKATCKECHSKFR